MTNWDSLPHDVSSLELILKRLRAPDGCPWDREQTRETLSRSLAEETAELLEAIDEKDTAHIAEELGDLLMNVVFQAVVAEEKGDFTLADVAAGINAKMIRRHKHIFGDAKCENSEQVRELWEQVKAEERKSAHPASVMAGIPKTLSALAAAEKIQKKAAKYGFDWQDKSAVLAKVEEELQEVQEALASGDEDACDEELGDLLFAVVNLIRFSGKGSAEETMRRANRKFIRRFQYMEENLRQGGISLSDADTAQMESLWQEAKKHE